MTQTLKNCPFCGHEEPSFQRTGTSGHSCIVECGWCGTVHESGDEYEQSGNSWNNRQHEKDKNTEIDMAIQELNKYMSTRNLRDSHKRHILNVLKKLKYKT